MDKTIKITGVGRISKAPDLTVVSLHVTKTMPTYAEALEASAEDVRILKDSLEEAGLERKSIKTTHFEVEMDYEGYYDKEHNYHRTFKGYRYVQSFRIEFGIDNKLLGKVLFNISHLPIDPEITIRYEIKDIQAAKDELLANAVKDATKKANIIADSAGVTIDGVVDINYSWSTMEFYSRSMNFKYCDMAVSAPGAAPDSYDVDIEPEDIEKSDSVTIVFAIK